jgi:hypothetical protein
MSSIQNAIRCGSCRFVALFLSILVAAIPGIADHAYSTHTAHIPQDPAGKECTRGGMPCSTAWATDSLKAKSSSTQLDQIERQTINSVKGASAGANGKTSAFRPAVSRGSERQSSINFTYHAPSAAGTRTAPQR